MTVQPARRSFGVGPVIGFLFLAAALYWLAVVVGILPENPRAVAITFLLILVAAGAGRFGYGV